MPAKKKPTLADRRRAARDNLTPKDPGTPPPAHSADNPANAPSAATTGSTPSAADTPSSPTPQSAESAPTAPSAISAAAAGGAGTISVSLTNQQLHDARAAFLADWEHGGPETFAAWIQEALRTHATRTTAERSTMPTGASGQTRSFRIADHTRAIIESAHSSDCAAGRWISLSAWAATAITTATEAARQRGPLPTPPDRLPGRLPARAERTLDK
ncbi:hypothetical protein [Arachnia propionica]|uniref:hypothetical protein n=1 Tax=Arachnia propionica TaxID=1750 RepID=UPI00163A0A15|nr:hypothetical protein [Arachnia propionica]